MKVLYTPHFKKCFKSLPKEVKKKFKRQIHFLLENLRHPSLKCKRYDGKQRIWQARIDRYYRFYFLLKGDTYVLLEVKPHPK